MMAGSTATMTTARMPAAPSQVAVVPRAQQFSSGNQVRHAGPSSGTGGATATAQRAQRPCGFGAGPLLRGASSQQQQPQAPAAASRAEQRRQPQIDQNNAVVAFLKDAGLQMYTVALLQSGFDDLETLAAIEDADMKDLGIPSYHAVRLRKKLHEFERQCAGAEQEPDASHPVVAFLTDNGLGQYARVLLKSGFDEMETLLLIDDLDLKELGVARGHVVKLKKRLRDYEIEYGVRDEVMPPHMVGRPPAGMQQLRPPPTPQQPLHRSGGRVGMQVAEAQHSLSESTKSTVEQSWEHVQAVGAYAVGELLYKHTFQLAPEAMDLFPLEVRQKYQEWSADEGDESDLWESAALRRLFGKVVNAVGCTVAGLHEMGKLVPMLTKLGMRHINYGVSEGHWPILGRALDMTLQDILGASYTQEVRKAWTMVYAFMSTIMIEGLRQAIKARDLSQARAATLEACGEISDVASQCSTSTSGRERLERAGGAGPTPGSECAALSADVAAGSEGGCREQAPTAQHAGC